MPSSHNERLCFVLSVESFTPSFCLDCNAYTSQLAQPMCLMAGLLQRLPAADSSPVKTPGVEEFAHVQSFLEKPTL